MVRTCFSLSMTQGPAMRKSWPVPTGTFWMLKVFTLSIAPQGTVCGEYRYKSAWGLVLWRHALCLYAGGWT